MSLEVFVWTSYSCNNSSDYRLIAEFETAQRASAMAKELATFFTRHAKEYDKQTEGADFDWPGEPTEVARALGKKYDHDWIEFLIWGEEQLEGDEPSVTSVGKHLVLYHSYSSGGFGPDIPAVIAKAGAKLPEDAKFGPARAAPPILAFELTLPDDKRGHKLEEELTAFFAQRLGGSGPYDWANPEGIEIRHRGRAEIYTFWIDDRRCGFTIHLEPHEIALFHTHLEKRGAVDVTVRVALEADVKKNKQREAKLEKAREAKAPALDDSFDPRGLSFLFTGKLAAMTRAEAEKRVVAIGGTVAKSVTKALDVLVVGDDGSPLFGDGTKGDKQRAAEKLVAAGATIRIVSESTFMTLGAPSRKRA